MSRDKKKSKKEPFVDDGRTIADMNVDGMPWYLDEAKRKRRAESEEAEPLSKSEHRAFLGGVMAAALLIGLVFALGFLAFILFCIFVWFR